MNGRRFIGILHEKNSKRKWACDIEEFYSILHSLKYFLFFGAFGLTSAYIYKGAFCL